MAIYGIMLLGLLGGQSVDPCDVPSSEAIGVEITLISSRFDKNRKIFYGTFEIKNTDINNSFKYGIFKYGKVAAVSYPNSSIEFLSLSGRWESMPNIPGSFRKPLDFVNLSNGMKMIFETQLVNASMANLNASQFRLLLRSADNKLCVHSEPFEGLPKRRVVERFQSVPRSQ